MKLYVNFWHNQVVLAAVLLNMYISGFVTLTAGLHPETSFDQLSIFSPRFCICTCPWVFHNLQSGNWWCVSQEVNRLVEIFLINQFKFPVYVCSIKMFNMFVAILLFVKFYFTHELSLLLISLLVGKQSCLCHCYLYSLYV